MSKVEELNKRIDQEESTDTEKTEGEISDSEAVDASGGWGEVIPKRILPDETIRSMPW